MAISARKVGEQLIYALGMTGLAGFLFLSLFAASFTLEESYPGWPMRPYERVLPPVVAYGSLAVIGFVLLAALVPMLRRPAVILAGVDVLAIWIAFYLVVTDTIVSKGYHG